MCVLFWKYGIYIVRFCCERSDHPTYVQSAQTVPSFVFFLPVTSHPSVRTKYDHESDRKQPCSTVRPPRPTSLFTVQPTVTPTPTDTLFLANTSPTALTSTATLGATSSLCIITPIVPLLAT